MFAGVGLVRTHFTTLPHFAHRQPRTTACPLIPQHICLLVNGRSWVRFGMQRRRFPHTCGRPPQRAAASRLPNCHCAYAARSATPTLLLMWFSTAGAPRFTPATSYS